MCASNELFACCVLGVTENSSTESWERGEAAQFLTKCGCDGIKRCMIIRRKNIIRHSYSSSFIVFQIQVIKNIIMSIKVKSQEELMCHNDVKKEFGDSLKDESRCGPVRKKRLPACLSILCPVCGGPAPDHVHFGGKKKLKQNLDVFIKRNIFPRSMLLFVQSVL